MSHKVVAADTAMSRDNDDPKDLPSVMQAVVLIGRGCETVTIHRILALSPQRMEVLCKVDSVFICDAYFNDA